jgi:hypothetical protein
MLSRKHFNRGRGPVTFICNSCDRRTRDTGQGSGIECCAQCYELAGYDNMFNDDNRKPTANELAECERLLNVISKRGGNAVKAKATFEYIWPAQAVDNTQMQTELMQAAVSGINEFLRSTRGANMFGAGSRAVFDAAKRQVVVSQGEDQHVLSILSL